jgi:hypothetical protein
MEVGALYGSVRTGSRGELLTAELFLGAFAPSRPALSTGRWLSPRAASQKSPIKLGCGCGPFAPQRWVPRRDYRNTISVQFTNRPGGEKEENRRAEGCLEPAPRQSAEECRSLARRWQQY